MPNIPTPIIVNSGGGAGGAVKTFLGIAGLAAGVYGVYKLKGWFDQQQAKSQLTKDQNTTIKPPAGKKVFYDLNGKPIQSANLATIATDLENALSYPVDNARALRVFKSTPFGSVKALEDVYLDKYKENLKDRMVSRLNDATWIKAKFDFR